MDIFLSILAGLGGIAILLLLLAVFLPKHYSVSVSETIDQPQPVVHDYVRMLGNQLSYSEWFKTDRQLQVVFTGTDGMVGTVMKWRSNNKDLGIGEQEIKQMDRNNIDIELRFIKPIAGVCRLNNRIISMGAHKSEYSCTFFAHAKFPVNLPAYVLGRRFIRKAQRQTLRNVKAILEQSKQPELV